MTAPFFVTRGEGLTVREIAALIGAEPRPGTDLDRRITGIAALDRATASDLAFFDKPSYVQLASACAAGACLVPARFMNVPTPRVSVLVAREPYRSFVEVARQLFPQSLRPSSLFGASGVASGAIVHPSARMESGVVIDPGAVIGPGAEIGAGTVIGAGAVIGPNVRIGRDCAVGANCAITHALIGDRVIIHPGCAIGQDGFGFVPSATGARKVPQVGRVIIQDDVEIGANTTIDRGATRDTTIGEGTKIDNLVQIAHNVVIGRHCLLAAHIGLSGSVVIEDGVMMGGQVGVADHLTIGAGAALGAQAGVIHDIPAGERWVGSPARPVKQFFREVATLARLTRRGKPGAEAAEQGD
jgi:UDP-3-O-[3-hydroxymyristoyl] glucosamine N-acyltransferase